MERDALLDALQDGTIGHAAPDVFAREPPGPDDALTRLPNVTPTAHAAYMTEEAYVTLWQLTLERLDEMRAGLAD